MDKEKEREKKQQYLCSEILDKNYDPNDFENFCKEVIMNSSLGGENYVDIDQWDFLELKLMVKNFQKITKTLDEQKRQAEEQMNTEIEEIYINYQQQDDQNYMEFQDNDFDEIGQNDQIEDLQIDQQDDDLNQKEEDYTEQYSSPKQNIQNYKSQIEQINEQDEDMFVEQEKQQDQNISNDKTSNISRSRSPTEKEFENLQQNIVSNQNKDFQSNIWQMPQLSQDHHKNSNSESNQVDQSSDNKNQDPFSNFNSFEKQPHPNQQQNSEYMRKKTTSKSEIQKSSINEQLQQIQDLSDKNLHSKDEKDKEDQMKKEQTQTNQLQNNRNSNPSQNQKRGSQVQAQSQGQVQIQQQVQSKEQVQNQGLNKVDNIKEKKRDSISSDIRESRTASVDSNQLQDLEFQKQMEEFQANDFKTLKQLNVYSGGLQPEVIESNNIVKMQCKKLGQSLLSTKKYVNVQIQSTKQIQSGLFGSVATYYIIQTKPFGWEVNRKFEDFQWLQQILSKMYPGIVIPRLIQPKKIKTERQEKNRMSFLEHFLNLLVCNRDIKNSKFIQDFLHVSDDKVFKEKMKESDKFPKPKNIGYILNYEGQVRLDYSNLTNKKVDEALNTYLDGNDGHYKKLKKLSKELTSQLEVVSNTLFEMGQIYTKLHSNTETFKQQVSQHNIQFENILDTYTIMNNINMMQANSIRDQVRVIENHYYHFFKFQSENNHSIKNISKLKTTMQDEYIKRININNQLYYKDTSSMMNSLKRTFSSSSGNESVDQPSKVNILKNKQITKINIYKIKEQEVLKDQIAYYTYQVEKQISSFFNDKCKSYATEFSMYSNLSQCFQQDMKLFWQDVLKSFQSLVRSINSGKKSSALKMDMMKKVS